MSFRQFGKNSSLKQRLHQSVSRSSFGISNGNERISALIKEVIFDD